MFTAKRKGYLRYTKCDMKKYYTSEKGGLSLTHATPLWIRPCFCKNQLKGKGGFWGEW